MVHYPFDDATGHCRFDGAVALARRRFIIAIRSTTVVFSLKVRVANHYWRHAEPSVRSVVVAASLKQGNPECDRRLELGARSVIAAASLKPA